MDLLQSSMNANMRADFCNMALPQGPGAVHDSARMSYDYDIFISYRRHPETLAWINEHFLPLLTFRVEMELKRPPTVFVDQQMEAGASWPPGLGSALGSSRVLIALWTGNYLSSVWCAQELAHMLGRESEAKLRTAKNPRGLVIPAFIHDGDSFPAGLKHILPFEIQSTFNPRMARNSVRAEQLDAALAQQASGIAACIESAPPWRKKWGTSAALEFYERFHRHAAPIQTSVPRFTGRK